MKVTDITVNAFWKGEYGVKGLVADGEQTYQVSLMIKGSQIRDYSCSCVGSISSTQAFSAISAGSSRGMCAHCTLIWEAFLKKTQAEKRHIITSQEARTMIREYTNREVGQITLEEEEAQVSLVPLLLLSREGVKLELRIGGEKLYVLKDLAVFARAVEQGAYVTYGKTLAFHHDISAFYEESRELVLFVVELVNMYQEYHEQFRSGSRETVTTLRTLKLSRSNLDRFFMIQMGRKVEIERNGSRRYPVSICSGVPLMPVRVAGAGGDGIRVWIDQEWYSLNGERHLYIGNERTIYGMDENSSRELRIFISQMMENPLNKREVLVQDKDITLFYERVLQKIAGYCRLEIEEGVNLEDYKSQDLKARFEFDSTDGREMILRPVLSYGEFSFHPVEDEKIPRTICRDVPGEFRISRLITRYFHHRQAESGDLVIRDDEEAVYVLMTKGIPEFQALGEVVFTEAAANMQVLPPPKVSVDIRYDGNWLDLKVDVDGLSEKEFYRILSAYTKRKSHYRLENGAFLRLDDGGLMTVAKLLEDLSFSKKDWQGKVLRVPSCRALYLDQILKAEQGVTLYRNQLFKALVRGIKAVEDSEYEVPKSLQKVLRGYQKTGFRWLKTLDAHGFGGILADDMGLGKTIQIISLLLDEKDRNKGSVSLVICPASLIYNWENEINTFAPRLQVVSVAGTAKERQELLAAEKPDVYITSYDLLKRDIEWYQDQEFRFQIIDEAQYIKNAVTQNARAVKRIRSQTRFALTGTPVENRLGELWSIFDYLMPGYLFKYRRFKERYEVPVEKEGDHRGMEQLRMMIGPFVLRRLKQDVLRELPDKLEAVVYSRLEGEQKSLYTAHALQLKQQLEQTGADEYRSGKIRILAQLMRLRQLCCDPALCFADYQGESAKLSACLELIQRGVDGGHKILLFSQFTTMLERIRSRLAETGISCYVLTGETSKEKRLYMVHNFQSDEVPVFLISLKAGGTGLNLTAADIVIHYDPWWNVAVQNQAADRAHRIGQDKQVTVFQMIAKDTIEENICLLQRRKKDLADQVIRGENVSFGELSKEELLRLLQS